MDAMPDEVLIHIFQCLTTEELILKVGNVCSRWEELVPNAMVWKNRFFTPPTTFNNEDIEYWLKKMPHLKHFKLQHGENIDEIVEILIKNCPNICNVVFERKHGPTWEALMKLLRAYPNSEAIDAYTLNDMFHMDYTKLFGSKYFGSSFCLMSGKALDCNKIQNYKSKNVTTANSQDEIENILRKNLNNVKYLSIGSRFGPRVANLVYQCKQVKKIFVFSDDDESDLVDFGKLSFLQDLDTLHMCLSSNTNVVFGPISYFGFSKLVKLELYCLGTLSNKDLKILWPVCPNLEHLRLRSSDILDEAFQGIGKCIHLKHVDLSFNNPGLHDECLKFLAQGCHELEFLDLSDSTQVVEYDLSILEKCKELRYLWLKNQDFTKLHFEVIPTLFPKLVELNILDCEGICNNDISKIKQIMPNLKVLTGVDDPLF